jgi:hypothetical protein
VLLGFCFGSNATKWWGHDFGQKNKKGHHPGMANIAIPPLKSELKFGEWSN